MSPHPRIVALGGGHGLYATLTALRGITDDLTAIVTVADDGGSSGRLRAELNVPPPGDLRMALSALCEDTEWGRTWRDVLQSRFATSGPLDGHAVGNLLIAALWQRTGGIVEGLDWVGGLLRAKGRVLPLADEPLSIVASIDTGDGVVSVEGQVAVATAVGRIIDIRLVPADPSVPRESIDAIDSADMVVLGPGSWYTSVLTHFLVPAVADALVRAQARTVLTLNIAHEDAETADTDRVDDIRALRAMVPGFVPAVVLADSAHGADDGLAAEVREWGARLVVAPLCADGLVDRHNPVSLSTQYALAVEAFDNQARHARR